MKKIIFISTGRCGTTRLAEILKEKLPQYTIVHQMRFSRIANITGNIMMHTGESDLLKKILYSFIIKKYYQEGKFFISTDPLTALIIPRKYYLSKDVCIIHIIRDAKSFAKSFFLFSRSRFKSFIAHNFFPFWQPGIWPLENILNRNILKKYEKVSKIKNNYFSLKYSINPNYQKITMDQLYNTTIIQDLINNLFNENIIISNTDLQRKANESKKHIN